MRRTSETSCSTPRCFHRQILRVDTQVRQIGETVIRFEESVALAPWSVNSFLYRLADPGHLARWRLLCVGGDRPTAGRQLRRVSAQIFLLYVSPCFCFHWWKAPYLFLYFPLSCMLPAISCRRGSPLKEISPSSPPPHSTSAGFFCIIKRFSSHPPLARFCLWYYLLAPALNGSPSSSLECTPPQSIPFHIT